LGLTRIVGVVSRGLGEPLFEIQICGELTASPNSAVNSKSKQAL
jgi:hypothetical protein